MLHIAGATTIHGVGEGATPSASTIRGSAAAGTNIPGASLTIAASNGTGTGGSGSLLFQTATVGSSGTTANSLATAMSIMPAGNVGVGTAAPAQLFEVAGTIQSSGPAGGNLSSIDPNSTAASVTLSWLNDVPRIRWGGTGTGSNNGFDLEGPFNTSYLRIANGGNVGISSSSPGALLDVSNSSGTGTMSIVRLNSTNAIGNNNALDFSYSGTAYARIASVYSASSSVGLGFSTFNGSIGERMRIDQNGNVGIGTTSPSYLLHVNGSVAGVGAYNQLSDARYKKNVQTLADSLAKILAIRGVTYNWIDEDQYGSKTQIGVLAQEIEKIVPEVVDTGSDGVKRVKYSDLVPLVIEAMKQDHLNRDAEIAQLKADGEAKDAEIRQLKTTTEKLTKLVCLQVPTAALCH